MTERKMHKYYRPRIQIPVGTMQSSPGEWGLYCLPVDGAEALARLTGYLRRQITYIGEYVDDVFYKGPNDDEWQYIVDLIGELESALVNGCDFSEIVTELQNINATLQGISDCTCLASQEATRAIGRLPDPTGYVVEGNVTYKNESDALAVYNDPTIDEEKCELAQAHYWYIFDAYTEKILPFAASTADKLTAAIVATATFGAVATFVGLPIAILSAIVAVLVNWAIDGSIENFTTWLYVARDEIVCAIYTGLPDLDSVQYNLFQVIDAAQELSPLDKELLKVFLGSTWVMTFVFADQQTNGTWDQYIEPGYCAVCAPPAETCKAVRDYVETDWVGGTVENQSNRAVIVGGTSTYAYESMTVPSYPAGLSVTWIPRSEHAMGSEMGFGVTEVVSGKIWTLGTTPVRDKGIEVTEYALFPSILSGLDVYVNGKQVSQNIELTGWCVAQQ